MCTANGAFHGVWDKQFVANVFLLTEHRADSPSKNFKLNEASLLSSDYSFLASDTS